MEEDVGVRVTRLRRRLSVERSEDNTMVGSPGPATPNIKRGGRLAAKPQLELINENTPVSSPRKTGRKSLATDTEEKIVTPSRRSARVKSNSSIVSDTLSVQVTSSPRAIRAARRHSQAGSDNEGPATPARQTRRTRKDSASSVENQEPVTLSKPLPVAEMVIEEEPENEVQKAVDKSNTLPTAATDVSPNSARKSNRLLEKRNRRSGSLKFDQDSSSSSIENKILNVSKGNEKVTTETEFQLNDKLNNSVESKKSNFNLDSNTSLLNKPETDPGGNKSNHNKSASTFNISGHSKSKRNRTKSWPVVTASDAKESVNFSDNELSKKRQEKNDRRLSTPDKSSKKNKSKTSLNEINISQSFLDTSPKRSKRKSETDNDNATNNRKTEVLKPKNSEKKSDNKDITPDMAILFENRPENVQISVYYKDSDSNSIGTGTANKNTNLDSEDQCVPEIIVIPNAEKNDPSNQTDDDKDKVSASDVSISEVVNNDVNNSCEPMDINETIHEEILQRSLQQTDSQRQSLSSSQNSIIRETDKSKRKSTTSTSTENTPDGSKNDKWNSSVPNNNGDSADHSKNDKRKSSISNTPVDTPDKSKNDKRKSSVSNFIVNTPDRTKNDERKSSITDIPVVTPDHSSISNAADDTPNRTKSDKRKSSISKNSVESPDKSKSKRTSSTSSTTADTPDVSKNDNSKSTLILSQSKEVSTMFEHVKAPKSALINEVLSKSDISEKGNKKLLKGNLSLNDLKGTPKQTSIQKLSMQTSTPITAQQNGIKTKVDEQKLDSAQKKKSNFSKSINETDLSEEDSDVETSGERNMHLDDEAEEASDNYESGDSQGEEERRYEAENEVVERGETLASDDDVSNDTDYEKDSFVVSSDPEDNDLLSGSGDDLTMSDKELSMSKKSKEKFNERKLKEQKNASREMFESRHKLNTSDKKSPTKTKKNRMRIDSSLVDSDEEELVKTRKPNRMRLDSTLDTDVKVEETNVSLNKKKKNKSVRESVGSNTAIDEKEITVFSESTITNADPLEIKLKQEPKTPQKDFDMSVVQVQQEIESAHMTGSHYILNQTGTDPLQATMAGEDTSDSSESEEILQNYDSVLNELNKDTKNRLSNNNISLNIGNKSKKNQAEPIIDQLNITQVKKSKKNKNQLKDNSESKTLRVSEKQQDSDNDSSNSIDLQLLFSEENCGSDEEEPSQKSKADDDNLFMPLKKSPGQTNLQDSIDMNKPQDDTSLNESSRKKKKRNSSLGPAEPIPEQDVMKISGNVKTLNESGLKKKKKKSLSETPAEEDQDVMKISGNVKTLNESGLKKKKKNSLSETPAEEDQDVMKISGNVKTLNESSLKKKKKNSLSETPAEEEQDEYAELNEPSLYESKKKKKKSKFDGIPCNTMQNDKSTNINTSINESDRKKKKKNSWSEPPAEKVQGDLFFIDTTGTLQDNNENTVEEPIAAKTPKSEKKKKKLSISEPSVDEDQGITIADAAIIPKSERKKRKHSISDPSADEPQENTARKPKSEKKKKKNSLSETSGKDSQENTMEESNAGKTPKSDKKKKKQKLECLVHDDDSDGAPDEAPYQSEKASGMDVQNIENVSESAGTGSSKKKHKKKKNKASTSSQSDGNIDTNNVTSNSKKRKRNSSNAESSQQDVQELVESGVVNEFVVSNKKRKISHNEDHTSGSTEVKQTKKNKKKNRDVNFQDIAITIETTETQAKKNKKRKHPDEDGDSKKTKVSKDSSFQEVHLPRLPDNILRQLDDKPRKTDSAKVIATSNFIVENARQKRAKPSNYLEESIYLDEKSPFPKKKKSRLNKPKVLPFIPTAAISDSGFTTKFKINKLSQFTAFEAEPVVFSKENYLQMKKIKRLGTYDKYKKQMRHKMSKF